MTANQKQAALEVGQLAYDMLGGFEAHDAAVHVLPRLLRDGKTFVRLISKYPGGSVKRKNGSEWWYSTQDALGNMPLDKAIVKELPLVWLRGALLEVGDALQRNNYFDHAPELELIYHLRNGIAHGNRFKFTTSGLERLGKHPAHNRNCYRHEIFEIAPTLDGQPVLFDFMEAGDVLDLLSGVRSHLTRIGAAEPPPTRIMTEAERQELIKKREAALAANEGATPNTPPEQ